jgi:hypothetical protein
MFVCVHTLMCVNACTCVYVCDVRVRTQFHTDFKFASNYHCMMFVFHKLLSCLSVLLCLLTYISMTDISVFVCLLVCDNLSPKFASNYYCMMFLFHKLLSCLSFLMCLLTHVNMTDISVPSCFCDNLSTYT